MKAKNIIIFLCLFASIVIVWQFILPLWDSVELKSKANASQKEEVDKLEQLINKLNELTVVFEQKKTEAERLSKFLPSEENGAGILNSIEMMGAQAGVIVDSIDWAKKGKEDSQTAGVAATQQTAVAAQAGTAGIKTLSANIGAAGTYEGFKNFLANLESSLRIIEIKQIKFSAKGEGGDVFDFDITAEMYYQ